MTMAANPNPTAQQAQSAVGANNHTQQPQNDIKSTNNEVMNDPLRTVEASTFAALQNIDLDQLEGKDMISVLPFLAKLLLNSSFVKRQQLLKLLYPIRKMNDVVQLLLTKTIDIHDIDSFRVMQSSASFESSHGYDRLKIVVIEYLKIQDRTRQNSFTPNPSTKLLHSDLFDNEIYVDDVSYCLCALLMKPTTIPVINILDMCEALLHLRFGPTHIIRLVANFPDRCQEVCHSLITYGERLDEGQVVNEISEHRAKTLRHVCQMNPSIAFTLRSVTLQLCKMPSLTVMITLDNLQRALDNYNMIAKEKANMSDDSDSKSETDIDSELIDSLKDLENCYDSAMAFIPGILLGVDENTRTWFAQYTKSAQQKRIDHSQFSILAKFRSLILVYINLLFPNLLDDDFFSGTPRDESSNEAATEISRCKMDPKDLNRKLIRATATLRLYCALRGMGSLKLNAEECDILLRLITCKPAVNQTSVNYATTGVCCLLVCSGLINNQKEERRAAEWLKWLIKESNYSDNRFSSHGKCSISELLLLIAIHFQNNQNNQVAELVNATLNMKLQIKASVSKCKSLFVQEVFNDQMVAEHAVKVPVTKNLNNNITEFLPVHCIHQLLESRSFSKHQVPIKDWIYTQICEAEKPIHNILPKLIEAYVNSVIISTLVAGNCYTNQPISEEDISRVFKVQLYSIDKKSIGEAEATTRSDKRKSKKGSREDPEELNSHDKSCANQPRIVDVEAAQVLLLYYLVLYEDVRLKKNPELTVPERAKLMKYNPDFMMEVPVFYLLQLVRDNQNSFGVILPDLLKLVTSQFPHLCSIQHWLNLNPVSSAPEVHNQSKLEGFVLPTSFNGIEISLKSVRTKRESLLKQLREAFGEIDTQPQNLFRVLSHISMLPKEGIWPFVNLFIENITRVLKLPQNDNLEYTRVMKAATKLWWKFNTIFPRKLWIMTVNALRRPQNFKLDIAVVPVEYSWDDLALDPLIVLRCDNRVFRCVDILNIVLHILDAFLAASRRCLQDQINEQPGRQKDNRNLEELKTTLVLAQTSAAIQILLESCTPSESEQEALSKKESGVKLTSDEELTLDILDANVSCICEHLHQVFIADTNLAKLVHFQTYPSELLSTTSGKIPSMHICLDFIPELLSQPDLSKQVFVIELTSHLCEKYAITKSLNVAKLCFNVAYTLLQLLPSARRAIFFIPVLPALLRICRVFPILREDADIILNQINQITLAHMASTSSRLSLGSTRPFEGLEKMSWREARRLMSSLNLHEALYLCIQKCSLDLDKLKESNKQQNMFIEQSPTPAYNTFFAYGNHVINPQGG